MKNHKSSEIISEKIYNIFKDSSSKKFIFVELGGNFGDYLIYKGAYKLARIAGIDFEVFNFEKFMNTSYAKENVIYVHGGGGFVPFWSGRPIRALKKALEFHKGVTVLGPTTFSNENSFLAETLKDNLENSVCERTLLFARDETSYGLLKSLSIAKIEIILDHDTALNLSSEDLIYKKPKSRYVLYAIRRDKEALNTSMISIFPLWVDPIKVCNTFEQWVILHAQAKEIVTNRLHSAILGSILNINTQLFNNSYHKNRSVWQFSLAGRGVVWIEQKDVAFSRLNRLIPFLRKFVNLAYRLKLIKLFYFGFSAKKIIK